MTDRGRKASQLLQDYAATLSGKDRAVLSMYLTRVPVAGYEALAHVFDFVKLRW